MSGETSIGPADAPPVKGEVRKTQATTAIDTPAAIAAARTVAPNRTVICATAASAPAATPACLPPTGCR